jgi:hypothetical protein
MSFSLALLAVLTRLPETYRSRLTLTPDAEGRELSEAT